MFEKKISIVTGGASGIGKALCEALAEKGSTVIVADLNFNGAKEVAEAIQSKGRYADVVSLNVADLEEVQSLMNHTAKTYGKIDFLFNSAGIAIGGETWRMDIRRWQKIVDINLWGTIYTSTEAYKHMIKQRSGHIINVASGAGLFPTPMRTPYSTTKYGAVGFSVSLRPEAAAYGIKVSVVCPGPVQTPILETSEIVGAMESLKKELKNKNNWMAPERAAQVILKGVKKNKAIIPVTAIAAFFWKFYSFFPGIYDRIFAKKMVKGYLKLLQPGTLSE
jgi:NAD(P)-dependent dehydrogenase (short-subunit alcohol dehydrogenase family)